MRVIATLAIFFATLPCSAREVTYRAGGHTFANAWHEFYDLGDHEPELDDPLIRRGAAMVPAICGAVTHKDMKYRRYALSALGHIRDSAALPCLGQILRDKAELEYFRGDALQAIYFIDQDLGERYAIEFGSESSYLRLIADLISKGAFNATETGLEQE